MDETTLELLAYLISSALIGEPSVNFEASRVTVNGGIEHLEMILSRALGAALAVMPSVQLSSNREALETATGNSPAHAEFAADAEPHLMVH